MKLLRTPIPKCKEISLRTNVPERDVGEREDLLPMDLRELLLTQSLSPSN